MLPISSQLYGHIVSLVSRLLICYLIYREIRHYREAHLVYQFEPDVDTEKVHMHVDITVAMPCSSLSGVDLMDDTQQDVFAYGTLQRQDVWWQMKPQERREFTKMQQMNHFLREQYHSVADLIFKDIIKSSNSLQVSPALRNVKTLPKDSYDACRLHGTLGIHKVCISLWVIVFVFTFFHPMLSSIKHL